MTREEKWKKDEEAILALVKEHDGVVKTSELYTLGIDYRRIQSFVDWGLLLRVKNGYYALQDQKLSEEPSYPYLVIQTEDLGEEIVFE